MLLLVISGKKKMRFGKQVHFAQIFFPCGYKSQLVLSVHMLTWSLPAVDTLMLLTRGDDRDTCGPEVALIILNK